ncbi:protein mono-ADP-ribosyltransferase PARP14-like isoform X2 [Labeo rohita]|uniref:protein mono-ADP-ribosyltransferase PARP14-like isoform X2 n=1 Tax=Labeo rohita TaxID=84645 RepID=UPI0021E2DF80|nr:protein mono-ADP-ribosyltransferase PARP14-like isoform X2 [Labeo rohita]
MFKCLGCKKSNKSVETNSVPEPVTFSVHPAVREFILKKGHISSIKDQMSSHFCQINMEKSIVFLSPDPVLLKQKGVTREHIDGWSKNAIDAFKKIISNYTTTDWPVSHPLWSKVESDVKEVVKDQVFTYLDASKEVLTLAGMTHEITGLKPIMEKILERATNQMEREKNSVTEYMKISPAMYLLLELDGLKNALAVSPELHTDYNKKMNRLVLSGLHTEICMFKNWVLQKQINRKKKSIQTEHSILEFLKSVDCGEMSRDLFISNGITAVYTIENGDVVVIGSTERALNEAESMINTNLTTKDLIVEDQGVLQMPEWLDLKKHLQELFSTSKKSSVIIHLSKEIDKVMVTGFREPVMKVSQDLGDFIEKHTRIEETVRVKSHAAVELIKDRKSHWQHFTKSDKVKVSFDSKRLWIKLSGERTFVQPAVTFFKTLADGLYTDTLIIKKTGAKKYFMEQGKIMLSMFAGNNGFVAVLQEDTMPEEEKDNFSQGPLGRVSSSCFKVYTLKIGHLTLEVSSGDITQEKTDAIVNSSNQTFSLKSGVSKAILDGAGLQVEQELSQMARDTNYQLTEIVTSSGDLPCKEIIHIVGSNKPSDIQQKVLSVLKLCEKHRFTSVAFPALGTGQGGANSSDVADAMINAVVEFANINEHVHVRNVEFLIFNTSTLADFHQSMLKCKPKKSIIGKIKGKNILFEEIEPVMFQLCGETLEDLSKASALINSLINKENMHITICDPAIAHFSKEELEMLSKMEKELKIERVQNSALWRNYMIKKEELEDKNKHKNNEKLLFHGTGPDTTDQINNHGFNRSFAGMHGALYGNGTYFAVDPSYSSKGYSKPDNKGHKRMYLARVLVGDFTQGTKGLPTPPKKSSQGVHLYDSVTDNMNNPTMFVIFNDVQAYPEYLITFRDK